MSLDLELEIVTEFVTIPEPEIQRYTANFLAALSRLVDWDAIIDAPDRLRETQRASSDISHSHLTTNAATRRLNSAPRSTLLPHHVVPELQTPRGSVDECNSAELIERIDAACVADPAR